jgi:hypothetical protein
VSDNSPVANGPAVVPALPTPAPAIPQNAAFPAVAPALPEIVSPKSAPLPSDMALEGGPMMQRGDALLEMRPGYHQSGRIAIDGDTVTQQLGRGKTAEYSLAQLAAHSKDPAYFEATMKYAADRGDSVNIGFRDGETHVRDAALEHRLPQDMPLRDPILRASVMHNIDPVLLAAVGIQETHLGADYMGSSIGYDKTTHRGDVEADSPGGHGYGPFQYDDQKRGDNPGRAQADLDRVAADPYYAADKAAGMLASSLQQTGGNVRNALHLYNAGSLSTPSTTTDWGSLGKLPYEDSALKYYGEVQQAAGLSVQQGHTR